MAFTAGVYVGGKIRYSTQVIARTGEELFHFDAFERPPDWTPDGRLIVISEDGRLDLHVTGTEFLDELTRNPEQRQHRQLLRPPRRDTDRLRARALPRAMVGRPEVVAHELATQAIGALRGVVVPAARVRLPEVDRVVAERRPAIGSQQAPLDEEANARYAEPEVTGH